MVLLQRRGAVQLCFWTAIAVGQASYESSAKELELMAETGNGFSSIGVYVGINDSGVVCFTAVDAEGSKAFVVRDPDLSESITFVNTNRSFSGAAINNKVIPRVASRDRLTGAPPTYFIRKWSNEQPNDWDLIGKSPNDFDSAQPFVDISDAGIVTFSGLVGGSTSTALFAGSEGTLTRLAVYPDIVFLRPQISNDNRVVIRDNLNRIMVWPYPTGDPEFIAGTNTGFTMIGREPGISADGTVVSFAGDRVGAEGIFISVPFSDGRQLVLLAGEGSDNVTDIDADQRVAVANLGDVSTGQRIIAVFVGMADGDRGVYASEVVAMESAGILLNVRVGEPTNLVAIGDSVDGQTVTDVRLRNYLKTFNRLYQSNAQAN